MTIKHYTLLAVVALLLTCWAGDSNTAFAQSFCAESESMTDRIVTCFRDALLGDPDDSGDNGIAGAILKEVYTPLKGAITALIVLAIAIHGLKMQLGMVRELAGETIMLVIKIGLIVYFLEHFMDWFPKIMAGLEELLLIITQAATPSDPDMSMSCVGINPGDEPNVWKRVDCAVGIVFGFGTGVTMISGLVGIVVSSAFSDGTLGMTVFLSGVAVFVTLLLTVFRAVYVYLVAMIALTFLVALSPIFVPLALFQATKTYFTKWLGQMMTYLIQPVFLFAFLSMMLASFNVSVMTGDHSVAAVLFGEPVDNYSDWQEKMEDFTATNVSTCESAPFSLNLQPAELGDSELLSSGVGLGGASPLPPFLTGVDIEKAFGDNAPDLIGSMKQSVDGFMNFGVSVICTDFPKKTELYYTFFGIAVLAYILYTLLQYIPTLAVDLSVSGAPVGTAKLAGMAMPFEGRVGSALSQGSQSASQAGGSMENQMSSFLQGAMNGAIGKR